MPAVLHRPEGSYAHLANDGAARLKLAPPASEPESPPPLPCRLDRIQSLAPPGVVDAMDAKTLGAFYRLTVFAWASKPPCTLPNDPELLAKIARISDPGEWDCVWQMLGLVFAPDRSYAHRLVNPTARLVFDRRAAKMIQPRGAAPEAPASCDRRPLLIEPAGPSEPPSSFRPMIEQWAEHLTIRGKRPASIKSFASSVAAIARDLSWTTAESIDPIALEAYLAGKRSRGEWKGTTFNRSLAAFRNFFAFLRRKHLLASDPLEDIFRAPDDGDPGARAATVDEARAHIAAASFRAGKRRSAKDGNRLLQTLMLFQAGLRVGESARLEWGRHIVLDAEIPHIRWTKDIQKNRRHTEVAIHSELVALLRSQKAAMKAWSREQPEVLIKNPREANAITGVRIIDPDAAGSVVFPFVMTRSTFRKDSDCAQIEASDRRERRYSPHSARKYFQNELRAAGVHGKLIDYLMRHSVDTCGRYDDPSLREQAEALKVLPNLLLPRPSHA
ncbi:MAG: site-specific integrase [Phycisphaeraceae bacterium]|nr:site-specific integrase [Phycisphaeraceae bacterium]